VHDANLNTVVRSANNVLPRRLPFELMALNVRIVTTAVISSAANQVFPGPSAPEGQRVFLTLLK
jgi:hypothetical protein